jgi:hypothetical protein
VSHRRRQQRRAAAVEWQPIALAVVGLLVDLRCRDVLGSYDCEGPFFLHDDGRWYRVEPPTLLGDEVRVTHFRERAA